MKGSKNLLLLLIGILLAFVIVTCANVFVVTLGKYHWRSNTDLHSYIDSVNVVTETIEAKRGSIYDANGIEIARDEDTYDIICFLDESRIGVGNTKAYIEDISYTSRVLASILGVEEKEIFDILNDASDLYQTELGLIGKNINEETKDKIEEYNLPGVEFRESKKRNYPLGDNFSSYLVGFAQSNEDGKLIGKMGLEQFYNTELSGIDGKKVYQADKNGYILPGMKEIVTPAVDGYDIHLTIDSVIQDYLNSVMSKTVEMAKPDKVWGTVMEVKTGKILAWGQYPNFDPNKLDVKEFVNYGAQFTYEPGSVYKTFTYAAAIDQGKYDGNEKVWSDKYCFVADENDNPVRVSESDTCILNSDNKQFGLIPYDYGLVFSSNVTTATVISELITPESFYDYLNRFKLFDPVDLEGAITEAGYAQFNYSTDKVTATYGHGLTTTMINLMQAYSAVFGNGEMVKPYFIDSIVDKNGDQDKIIYKAEKEVVGRPIKESTAKELQRILELVVSSDEYYSTGWFVQNDKMKVMAKTGTATLPDENGHYDYYNDTIFSTVIGFPYEDPEYMIYYAFQKPYDVSYYPALYIVDELVNNIAMLNDIIDNANESEEIISSIDSFKMPNLINHSVDFAKKQLEGKTEDVVVIGQGKTVIDQYPKAQDKTYENQKVFLLTQKEDFKMIDVKGYTRKEITELWTIIDIPFVMDGYGIVYEQSIPKGEKVKKDSEIVVKLKKPDN